MGGGEHIYIYICACGTCVYLSQITSTVFMVNVPEWSSFGISQTSEFSFNPHSNPGSSVSTFLLSSYL